MNVVYLDKSAFSDLFRSSKVPESTRAQVIQWLVTPSSVTPTILVDPIFLTELAGCPKAQRDKELELLQSLPRVRLLKPLGERVQYEVTAHASGNDGEGWAYNDEDFRTVIQIAMNDAEVLVDETRALTSDRLTFVEDETRARLGMLADVGGQKPLGGIINPMGSNLDAMVAEWALDCMRELRDFFGLTGPETAWPDPRALPSLWAQTAYRMTRIWLVNRDGRAIDGNDYQDSIHYAASAYADTLVTSDRFFRELAEHCPRRRCEVLSLDAWVDRVINGNAPG